VLPHYLFWDPAFFGRQKARIGASRRRLAGQKARQCPALMPLSRAGDPGEAGNGPRRARGITSRELATWVHGACCPGGVKNSTVPFRSGKTMHQRQGVRERQEESLVCERRVASKEMNGTATVTESRNDLDAPPSLRRMSLPPSAPNCENVSSGKPSASPGKSADISCNFCIFFKKDHNLSWSW
jgi:hypothetical protein